MSIIKNITTLPDTRRTFESSLNNLGIIRGIFISKKTFSLTTSNFTNFDTWMQALENGNIIPAYYIQEYEDKSEETQYQESQQNFSYLLRRGRYRHVFKFDITNDRHNTLDALSGSDLYVFYWDINYNIYGYEYGGYVRGFKTNRIILEKQILAKSNTPSLSPIDIEWQNAEELNYIRKVTWNPADIDRLFITIKVEYIDNDNLNFSAKYLSETIDDIEQSGVSVIDDINGNLTFTQYNYLGGIYRLSGFSDSLTTGILQIISNIYLGCTSYKMIIEIIVTNYFLFENDDRLQLEGIYDGDLLILENV